jgi:polygalacturonase
MRRIIILSLLFCTVACGAAIPDFPWMKTVGAQVLPSSSRIYYTSDYGAVGDAETLCTTAIQHAIDACAKTGGGIVTFNPGIYLTGSIYLKKNVNLNIPKGTTLLGSCNIKDYPRIDTRIAGIEMPWPSAIINVIGQQNVAITGDGTINAQGKVFWDKYREMRKTYDPKGLRWIVDYDCERPQAMLVQDSEDVTVKGLVFYQSGFWTLHVLYSERVTIDGVIIDNNINGSGPSTDGIDIDSSSRILVQNCYVSCNDDNFCLKSGRDWDGLRVNRPCEYIVIHDCTAAKGDGLFTCGSETSGSIRHIVAYNLRGEGTKYGLRFKSSMQRGGVVEDIHLSNVQMRKVKTPFIVDLNWLPSYNKNRLPAEYNPDSIPEHWKKMLKTVDPTQGTPKFRDVYLNDVVATDAIVCIKVAGLKNSTIDNFHLDRVSLQGQQAGNVKFAKNWTFNDCKVNAADGSTVKVESSEPADHFHFLFGK